MAYLEKTITSLEVAEMVGRRHDQVLRDIRTVIKHLCNDHKNVEVNILDYFISTSYKDNKGEERNSFLLTKKGCELYSTRMTGEKGTQFAVAYIDRFNKMENHIKGQAPTNNTKLLLETALKHEEEIEEIKTDVSYLKDSMRVSGVEEKHLQDKGKKAVMNAVGGYKSNAYKKISRKVFSEIWRDFKNHFIIPRYNELPKKRYEDGMKFLDMWQPSTSLRIEIQELNNQQEFKELA